VALEGLKTKLLHNQNRAPLFDTAGFTRDLESAYVAMWERHQRGLSPEAFAIGSPL
jgi:predicted O-linked N-acetylglucosamine transferase (SPINDLY family)